MTPVDKNNEPLDTILRRAMRAEPGPATPECADATSLAAYSDRSLDAAERERLEMHFADCPRCQLLLADIARAEESARDARAPSEVPWYRRWRIAIPALAAVAAILVFIAIRRPVNEEPSNEVVAMAKREAPAVELAAPAPAAAPEMPEVASAPALVAPAPAPAPPASNEIATNEAKLPAAAAPRAQAMNGTAVHRMLRSPSALGAREMAAPASPVAAPALPPVNAGRVVAIAPAAPVVEPSSAAIGRPTASVSSELAINPPRPETPQLAESRGYSPPQQLEQAAVPNSGTMAAAPAGAAPANAGAQRFAGGEVGGALIEPPTESRTAMLAVISPPDRSVIWSVGKNGTILRLDPPDGRRHLQHSGVTTDLVAGAAPSSSVCWVVGRSGTIIRTTDGEHWELITAPSADNLTGVSASSARDANITTAGGQSFSTSDGGATWHRQ
jgi:hypothetical protein